MIYAVILNSKIDIKPRADRYVFVDGGLKNAERFNIKPDVIIGDFDSYDISKNPYNEAEIIKLNVRKDFSDGYFAIKYCVNAGAKYIKIYGLTGGRIDHVLNNFNLMLYPLKRNVEVSAHGKNIDIYIFRAPNLLKMTNREGYQLSILPITSKIKIKQITGTEYEVRKTKTVKLENSSNLLSNVVVDNKAYFQLKKGIAKVILLKKEN